MRVIVIDGHLIRSTAAFWDAYERQTDPDMVEGFGRNLDALNDALWGGPGYPGKCHIVLRNSGQLQAMLGSDFYDAVTEVIAEAEDTVLIVE